MGRLRRPRPCVALPLGGLWLTFGEGGSARPGVIAGIPSFVWVHRNLGAGLTSTANATDMDAARALGAWRSATTFTRSEPEPNFRQHDNEVDAAATDRRRQAGHDGQASPGQAGPRRSWTT